MWMLAGLGAIVAGLFLILRAVIPWLNARRTGVIRTQGARPQRIERAVEPERFKALVGRRLKGAGPGLLCLTGGIAWLAWNLFSLAVNRAAG